jgi:hypothetical protein
MRKTGRSRIEEQTTAKQWHLPLGEFFREALLDTVASCSIAYESAGSGRYSDSSPKSSRVSRTPS